MATKQLKTTDFNGESIKLTLNSELANQELYEEDNDSHADHEFPGFEINKRHNFCFNSTTSSLMRIFFLGGTSSLLGLVNSLANFF